MWQERWCAHNPTTDPDDDEDVVAVVFVVVVDEAVVFIAVQKMIVDWGSVNVMVMVTIVND